MTCVEKFWRDATAADVVDVMNGKEVEARFRDGAKSEWWNSRLTGWQCQFPYQWIGAAIGAYCECQVYAPDQWYLDKPDPGEGYRLLEKFPDEAKLVTDEVYLKDIQHWQQIGVDDGKQKEGIWYRRKIEPKPEPKFAVGQRVKIIGPVCGEGPIYNWTKEMDKYIGVVEFVRSQPQQTFEGVFYQVSNIANWSFREDYLEAVVEPEPKHYVLQVGDTAEFPDGALVEALQKGVFIK